MRGLVIYWRFRMMGREEVFRYLSIVQSVHRKVLCSVQEQSLCAQTQEPSLPVLPFQIFHSWVISYPPSGEKGNHIVITMSYSSAPVCIETIWIFLLPQFPNTIYLVLVTSLLIMLHHSSYCPWNWLPMTFSGDVSTLFWRWSKNARSSRNVQEIMNDHLSAQVKFSIWNSIE